jgi:hypothetical protein
MNNFPCTAKPPKVAAMAGALVTVARTTLAPPGLVELRSDILGLAIDILMSAEFPGECFFVAAACNGNRSEAHLRGKLHAQVAQPADAENRDRLTRPSAAVAQGIECRHAGTDQRARLYGGKPFGQKRKRTGVRNHVVRVTAVVRQAGDATGLTRKKISVPACIAVAAIAAMPTDADPLTLRHADDAGTQRLDGANHLVPGNARVFYSGHRPALDH